LNRSVESHNEVSLEIDNFIGPGPDISISQTPKEKRSVESGEIIEIDLS
jgi:hypothetical protein